MVENTKSRVVQGLVKDLTFTEAGANNVDNLSDHGAPF